MKYLLDANVFIQAHRFYYPFDVFPSFWEWLIEQNKLEKVFSIQEIYDELKRGKDDLWNWVNKQDKSIWFLPVDDKETQLCFSDIANWINKNAQFKPALKNMFLDVADPWLIAKAIADDFTIVTQEKSDPKSQKKIHIPDVCKQFKVPWMDTTELLRELGGKF